MEPTRLFPIIVLLSLVTVEYGGWALLGFLTGRGTHAASDHPEQAVTRGGERPPSRHRHPWAAQGRNGPRDPDTTSLPVLQAR